MALILWSSKNLARRASRILGLCTFDTPHPKHRLAKHPNTLSTRSHTGRPISHPKPIVASSVGAANDGAPFPEPWLGCARLFRTSPTMRDSSPWDVRSLRNNSTTVAMGVCIKRMMGQNYGRGNLRSIEKIRSENNDN